MWRIWFICRCLCKWIIWNEENQFCWIWLAFHFVCCHRLPWDSTTPSGYFWEIFLSTVYIETYYTVNGPVLLLFVSICMHNQAFYQMFSHAVREMDDLHDVRKEKAHIFYLVRFHVTIKEWVPSYFLIETIFHRFWLFSWLVETIEVYSPFLLIQMICLTMYLACSVFQLDFVRFILDFSF